MSSEKENLGSGFNRFSSGKTWTQKVMLADDISAQVSALLQEKGASLPKTPRRPDVRLILNNTTGQTVQFLNPGAHSDAQEIIPASGDKTAVMVMLRGDTLETQYTNAKILYQTYDLGNDGLSERFIADLKAGKLSSLIAEAYGPAPFDSQAEKLVEVLWPVSDVSIAKISPVKGAQAAFGSRAATDETVFLAMFDIYVKGSTTTPELVESDGMCIAVSEDWQTKKVSTRPIVPSVAKTYYGAHFDKIPVVKIDLNGQVLELLVGHVKGVSPQNSKPAQDGARPTPPPV